MTAEPPIDNSAFRIKKDGVNDDTGSHDDGG
jgi:hypothetical protein